MKQEYPSKTYTQQPGNNMVSTQKTTISLPCWKCL